MNEHFKQLTFKRADFDGIHFFSTFTERELKKLIKHLNSRELLVSDGRFTEEVKATYLKSIFLQDEIMRRKSFKKEQRARRERVKRIEKKIRKIKRGMLWNKIFTWLF